MDYKALYEQTLKENEDLYEELEGKEVLAKAYKEHKIEIMKLQEENKELKDFDNWENHPALKHKVVLDDVWYQEHLRQGELIDPDEFEELKKDVKYWKNFALVYWSGNELGNLREAEKGPGGGEVWTDALEKVTDNFFHKCELTSKCMAD